MLWLALAVCLLASFLFTGIEAGLLSVNPARLRGRVRAGDPAAQKLDRLLARPGRLLATVLLVTNFADVAALVLVTDALVARWGSPAGYVLAGALLLPVYLIGVQILPRFLFRRFPYRALATLSGLLHWTGVLLSPLLALGAAVSRAAGSLQREDPAGTANPSAGGGGTPPAPPRSVFVAREELKNYAAEGERHGALTPAERGMIHAVVDLRGVRARDVTRPLPPPFTLGPAGAGRGRPTVGNLLAHARAHGGLECVLVVAGDAGAGDDNNPNGRGELLALLDTFTLRLERDPGRDVLAPGAGRRPPVMVRPEDPAYAVIRRLRTARSGYAAVSEAGSGNRPTGIVRARDLVERLAQGAAAGG